MMVKYSPERLDTVFSALADPTRRGIVARLAEGEASVGELAAPYEISLPAVSRHLRVLEDAGLLRREKDGRVRRCTLEPEPMLDALEWIGRYGRFWEHRLDSLGRHLGATASEADGELAEGAAR